MGILLLEMSWGRRVLVLIFAGIGALLFGIGLSAAFARPADAAVLPLPSAPGLPVPAASSVVAGVTTTGSGVVPSATALPSNVITGTTGAGSSIAPTFPTSPLPGLPITKLPVPQVPLPHLPVITMPSTGTLTSGVLPAGTTGAGPVPGTGGAAHGAAGIHLGPSPPRSGSTRRSGRSSSAGAAGSPVRAPTHLPSPSFPLVPGSAGDASAPGHGNNPWNAFPLTILLLTALGLGGVFLRRRLPLTPLFDSRLAPPG